jgi:hypothetical protein
VIILLFLVAKKHYKDSDFPEGVYLASGANENALLTQHQDAVGLIYEGKSKIIRTFVFPIYLHRSRG